MNLDDFPAPKEGFVITHVLVVADLDRSREFYRSLLGGQVLLERDPVIIKVANTWLTLVTGGGPTGDKPCVSLSTPADPERTSGFLNVRVADIARTYQEWSAKGAEFLTEPKITDARSVPTSAILTATSSNCWHRSPRAGIPARPGELDAAWPGLAGLEKKIPFPPAVG